MMFTVSSKDGTVCGGVQGITVNLKLYFEYINDILNIFLAE